MPFNSKLLFINIDVVTMDSWTDKQIKAMSEGGNEKCNSFLAQYKIAKSTPIHAKYNSPAAKLYKDRYVVEVSLSIVTNTHFTANISRLSATIEGRPLPTELPAEAAGGSSALSQVLIITAS